jgi:multidrug efflux pump subunit AcrA (membrane-fusion protein)
MTDRSKTPPRFLAAALLALLAALPACSSGSGEEGDPDAAHAEAAEGGEAAEGAAEGAQPGRVTLSEAAFVTARIETGAVASEAASAVGAGGLQAPGQVDFDPARVAVVSPRTAGRIERLTAVPGDRVASGETVALVSSREYLTAQSDLAQAARRARLLAGTEDEPGARALMEAARRRLRLLGAGPAAIARLERGGEPSPLLGVPAPFAGSILETLAPAGSAVEAGTPIFRIADLSTVLVAADVPERALGSLRTGQGATVRLAAFPDRSFSGRVERIGDVVDPQARTVKAMVRVPNPGLTLRPGMFATVGLDVPGAEAAPAGGVLTIPSTAVVTAGDTRYVFVEVGPRTYERRAVELGAGGAGGRMVVTSGLAGGERVVTRGAFTLKSELGKAEFGEDEH